MLFDMESTYSYLSISFTFDLDMLCVILDVPIHISSPIGESVIVTHVYRVCPILFMEFQTQGDFVILDMDNFYIILGMTWFSPYYFVLYFITTYVTLEIPISKK